MQPTPTLSQPEQTLPPMQSASKPRNPLIGMAWIMLVYTGIMGHYHWIPDVFAGCKWAPMSLWHAPVSSLPFFKGASAHSLCFFQQIVGLPCLFCGMTRSFALLSQGEWQASLHYHLLGIPFYAATWGIALSGLFRPDLTQHALAQFKDKRVLIPLLLALLACWIWKLSQDPAFW